MKNNTSKRPWTRYGISSNALRQLDAATTRYDGSLHPGVGFSASKCRANLIKQGLAKEVPAKKKRNLMVDTIITALGREALIDARLEGW